MNKCFFVVKAGGPEALELREDPVREPGLGEIAIRVEALALNQADLLYMDGNYVEQPEFPSRLGFEAAGVVDSVGPGVSRFRVGDRVATFPGARLQTHGVFAERAVVPEQVATHYPDHLTPAQGASIWVAYLTGYFALFELHHLKPGEFVLITAASSSTGIAAAQLTTLAGATPIGTTRTRTKVAQLNALGIEHVIATAEDDLLAQVANLTNGRGADVVYDCVGGAMLEPLMNAAAPGGDYFLYGLMDPRPATFPVLAAFTRTFDCYMIYTFVGHPGLGLPSRPEAVARGLRLIQHGFGSRRLTPHVGKNFQGLASIPEAMRFMQRGEQVGKIVVEL